MRLRHRLVPVGDLVGVLTEEPLGTEDQVVGPAELDGHMPLAVFFSMRLGLLNHRRCFLAERGAAGDLPGLLLAGGVIGRRQLADRPPEKGEVRPFYSSHGTDVMFVIAR
jgi:hypothetical protein